MPTQIRKINKLIDRAQHVIGWHELFEAKLVEKALLHHEPIAHHRPNPSSTVAQENHSERPTASPFSTKSARRRLVRQGEGFPVIGVMRTSYAGREFI
jgi:hypothetical protein